MRRREFITLVGAAAVAWPLAARAQQAAMPVVGFVNSGSSDGYAPMVAAFRDGLKEAGFVEGGNVAVELFWADDQPDRLPSIMQDLVRRHVAAITATGNQLAPLAAKAATTTIPIVFSIGADPLENGLVSSLNRPGGNITGVTELAGEVTSKRIGLVRELMPSAATLGILGNPNNPGHENGAAQAMAAARSVGFQVQYVKAASEGEFEAAFATLAQLKVDVLTVLPDSLFNSLRSKLIALAARHAIPAMYSSSEFAVAGGLMSYGSSLPAAYRQAGIYTGRILKGEKPGDLPVFQPTTFELVINLKTAKALGLEIPPQFLARADDVIE